MRLTGYRRRGARSPPPCRPRVWRGCLGGGRITVVGVGGVENVEVCVVDGGGEALHAHLVALGVDALAVESGLGDVEEGVDQRPFS